MTTRQLVAAAFFGFLSWPAFASAPDIGLPDLDGHRRNVNEFVGHGKWTVVVIWAHDCEICAREIGEMSAFHIAHQKRKDASVLGVSLDGADQLKAARTFAKQHQLPFPNLVSEPSEAVLKKFGAGNFVGTPTYYIYNPKGEIVGQNTGPVTRQEVEDFIASEPGVTENAKP